MKDDNIEIEIEGQETEEQDNTSSTVTYTQIACSAFGPSDDGLVDRRRQGLRARLKRERYERELKKQKSFINTFRNLFGASS
jgi:hypothetical protein